MCIRDSRHTYPFPRFRALALLGRRLPERMDGIFIPASEKPAQKQTLVISPLMRFPHNPKNAVWSLLPRRPVEWNHTSEDERHSDFRFDVRQVIRNPPRGVGVPFNERRIAGREISVKPEGHAH